MCSTIEEWKELPKKFANSRDPNEKEFCKYLTEYALPKVLEDLAVCAPLHIHLIEPQQFFCFGFCFSDRFILYLLLIGSRKGKKITRSSTKSKKIFPTSNERNRTNGE